jgi:hypothetical protein
VLVGDATVYVVLLSNPCGSAPFASWDEPKDDLLIEVLVLLTRLLPAGILGRRALAEREVIEPGEQTALTLIGERVLDELRVHPMWAWGFSYPRHQQRCYCGVD